MKHSWAGQKVTEVEYRLYCRRCGKLIILSDLGPDLLAMVERAYPDCSEGIGECPNQITP